jgi:hypothetical protein
MFIKVTLFGLVKLFSPSGKNGACGERGTFRSEACSGVKISISVPQLGQWISGGGAPLRTTNISLVSMLIFVRLICFIFCSTGSFLIAAVAAFA